MTANSYKGGRQYIGTVTISGTPATSKNLLLSPAAWRELDMAINVNVNPPGTTWVAGTPADVRTWYDVAYGIGPDGIGIYSAVAASGTGGRCMWATDPAGTWTLGTSAGDYSWIPVIWTGVKFVTASYDGHVANSVDGKTYTIRTAAGSGTQYRGLATNGAGTVIAVANNGYAMISTNHGDTWAALANIAVKGWQYIAYCPSTGVWAAGASDGTIQISTNNGANWATQTSHLTSITGMACDGTTFVAIGNDAGNPVATSDSSGTTWATKAVASVHSFVKIVAARPGVFFAVVNSNYASHIIATFDSGATWGTQTTPLDNGNYLGICCGPDCYVAIAASGTSQILVSGVMPQPLYLASDAPVTGADFGWSTVMTSTGASASAAIAAKVQIGKSHVLRSTDSQLVTVKMQKTADGSWNVSGQNVVKQPSYGFHDQTDFRGVLSAPTSGFVLSSPTNLSNSVTIDIFGVPA
jgi:hypothetical protein